MDLPPLAERYRPVRELGRGGFGCVVLAEDTVLGRQVAVKLLDAPVGEVVWRERFEREARLTASIVHPHVVRVLDHGIGPESRPFITYELLEGRSLAEQPPGAPEDTALGWARQLAEALSAIHAAGIVHRDMKPGNVLLRPDGTVVVVDFGISRGSEDKTLTMAGVILGTPAFLSPEVWLGEPAGPSSDQFALAATLVMVLAGESVYGSEDPYEITFQVTKGRPPRLPVGFESEYPRLAPVLARGLADRPAGRFPSVGDWLAALPSPGPGPTPDPESALPAHPTLPLGPGGPSQPSAGDTSMVAAPWRSSRLPPRRGAAPDTSAGETSRIGVGVRPPPATPVRGGRRAAGFGLGLAVLAGVLALGFGLGPGSTPSPDPTRPTGPAPGASPTPDPAAQAALENQATRRPLVEAYQAAEDWRIEKLLEQSPGRDDHTRKLYGVSRHFASEASQRYWEGYLDKLATRIEWLDSRSLLRFDPGEVYPGWMLELVTHFLTQDFQFLRAWKRMLEFSKYGLALHAALASGEVEEARQDLVARILALEDATAAFLRRTAAARAKVAPALHPLVFTLIPFHDLEETPRLVEEMTAWALRTREANAIGPLWMVVAGSLTSERCRGPIRPRLALVSALTRGLAARVGNDGRYLGYMAGSLATPWAQLVARLPSGFGESDLAGWDEYIAWLETIPGNPALDPYSGMYGTVHRAIESARERGLAQIPLALARLERMEAILPRFPPKQPTAPTTPSP